MGRTNKHPTHFLFSKQSVTILLPRSWSDAQAEQLSEYTDDLTNQLEVAARRWLQDHLAVAAAAQAEVQVGD